MLNQRQIKYKWNFNFYKDQIYEIPEINCPFPFKCNPNLSSTIEQHLLWIRNSNLLGSHENYEKFIKLNTQLINAYCHPLNNEIQFITINKLNDWGFIIDDIYLEPDKTGAKDYVDKLFNINYIHNDPLSKIFWEIFDEAYKYNNKEGIDKYLEVIKKWVYSVLEYNKNNKINSEIKIEEYIKERYYDVGAEVVLYGVIIGYNQLPKEITEHENYKQLKFWYTGANMLVNDIYSFKKEFKSDRLGNYVKIKTIQSGSIQKAIDFVVNYINICYQNIILFSDKTQSLFPENELLKIFILNLKYETGGILFIHKKSKRYNGDINENEIRKIIINEEIKI
jgi:hypothetical protein